ncbi:Uncharacterized protein SCF082_LOCUS51521 [Durusdinium trenchii]|uniref:Uncharacterized protein n=1 Tax=Durusdinium trenchii TaxID=1381693 RepID=A0ABP0SF54_9DINO
MDFCRNLDRAKEVAPVRAGSQRLLETAQTGRICNIDIIELLFRGGVPTQSGSDCCRRADALDVGQNLAAEAAAKKDAKPRVQVERDRWEEEKQETDAEKEVQLLKRLRRSQHAIAKPTTEPGGQDHLEDLSAKRSLRRSWTTSMSQAGKLVSAILRPFEDGDTPGNSTVVSAAASEVASDSDTPSLKPSPRESKDIKAKSKVSRITFEGSAPLDTLEKQESDSEEEELPQGIRRLRVGSDASSVGRKSDTSSVNWRADALDVGENLAAEAAAKKGHTSIDSIVALVEAERERWDEEKQALEAKLEELKDHLRSMQAQLSPDAEKQALKAQYQELRKAMKARSRFGAWVCERHMIESDDEEPNAEREELRNKISELSTRLRQVWA